MIPIRIKDGHQIDGEGEGIGEDAEGNAYTFWRSSGHMDVPADVAMRLETERPQRYEIVDREMAARLLGKKLPKVKKSVAQPLEDITRKKLEGMSKDGINDWAAKNDYEANPRDSKKKMILNLAKQIKTRTGKRILEG